jgi:hypothetical protein
VIPVVRFPGIMDNAALSAACLTVGADFQGLMAGADPALDAPLTNFSQVAATINNESRRIMVDVIVL